MDCPLRVDENMNHKGWNQNLSSLDGITNSKLHRDRRNDPNEQVDDVFSSRQDVRDPGNHHGNDESGTRTNEKVDVTEQLAASPYVGQNQRREQERSNFNFEDAPPSRPQANTGFFRRCGQVLAKFGKFIGPGFMVSVAYIDPGNYSTDVAAGSTFKFKLLFIVFMSNIFAIFLQSLCVKLGTVTGLNLPEHCKAHLPKWLNIVLYLFAEAAIIATDIAEVWEPSLRAFQTYSVLTSLIYAQVIGSAIALNLLFQIPLVAGCALTLADVLIILLFYNPSGSMGRLRAFEFFVVALVLSVVICFGIQLSLIRDTSVGEVLKGYLPSSVIVESQGYVTSPFSACSI